MNPKIYSHLDLIKIFSPEVKKIFEVFLKEGGKGDEIKLVGGCVRDLLNGGEVKDYDFASKFLPEEIIVILEKNNIKAIPTGIKFGTITAVTNHQHFEITTLRKDNENDGRHCVSEFVDDYFLDAARRDFTINALYLDSKGLVYDYFDGISDLKNKKVKFIGDADERISEDYLRILRFFRFNARYAENIDQSGLRACINAKENLKKLSKERIREEILKMLKISEAENLLKIFQAMKEQKIWQEIFSHELDISGLERLFAMESKLEFTTNIKLKIAAIFLKNTDNLKVFFYEICATNLEKRYFEFLSKNFPLGSNSFEIDDLKLLLPFCDQQLILDLYLFSLLQNFTRIDFSTAKKNIQYLENFSLPEFPLNGEDLMQLGFKKEKIGIAMKRAKEFWAKNNFSLDRNSLVKFLNS